MKFLTLKVIMKTLIFNFKFFFAKIKKNYADTTNLFLKFFLTN